MGNTRSRITLRVFVVGPKTRSSSPRRTVNLTLYRHRTAYVINNTNARHYDKGCWYIVTTKSHGIHNIRPSQMPITERYQKEGTPSTFSCPVYNNFNIHAPMCRTMTFLYCNTSPDTASQIIVLLQTPVMA
jgi:hypothetical protein